ncbi:DUF1049 domain-containing protein [Pseudomonas fluorescens]|uniref:DUF1049 domain-containing protein n=1 Tax=Pseudomonas fluorescens TaxID=294 RepID=A0AAE2PUE2_PSEFL|nr:MULTISPECIES: lipopolysaccharide assembly protein LapA domain-containing protein [Pseudomonas fluorescens group]MBD8150272.1 DUF1049 domain-containing protein [Pseudomonas fluorescens]MBD8178514.1 DUF1049 domain-containing protein [Pseudomonas fluorescens]MBD8268303.1 DUF1049 domain-containing protein [Pseudomonas fluorescens]MBD8747789.1 DUF1049 domain-containing protein [Pseudomonas fluorescens]MBD8753482.1 DUF1049 domain-containing protein [Pseudomonas fluorescens]
MRQFKRIFTVIIASVVALVTVGFVLENQQPASLSFLGWSSATLPVSVFVTLALILGLLLGPVVSLLFKPGRGRKKDTGSVI